MNYESVRTPEKIMELREAIFRLLDEAEHGPQFVRRIYTLEDLRQMRLDLAEIDGATRGIMPDYWSEVGCWLRGSPSATIRADYGARD